MLPEQGSAESLRDAIAAARARRTHAMALRRHADGSMDDVVIKDVETFRAEQLSEGSLWMACYFRNGDRITFNVQALRKNDLVYDAGEMPTRWMDIDTGTQVSGNGWGSAGDA